MIAIVFCGTYDGIEGTYAIFSSDGGDKWSQVSYMSNGSEADVAVLDGRFFTAMFRSDNGTETFYILRGDMSSSSSSSFANLTAVVAMSVPTTKVELFADDHLLHLALLVDRSVVVGTFDAEGDVLVRPAAVWSAVDGDIADIALGRGTLGAEIWLTYNTGSKASLRHGVLDPSGCYSFVDIITEASQYGEVAIADGEGTMAAWERLTVNGSDIMCALIDHEEVAYAPSVVSNGNAVSPSVVATDGFDIVFIKDYERPELYSYRDVMFTRPDLERLVSWVSGQDASIFHTVGDRDALVESLDGLLWAFTYCDEQDATSQVADVKKGVEDIAASLNRLDLRSDRVLSVIDNNLDHYLAEEGRDHWRYSVKDRDNAGAISRPISDPSPFSYSSDMTFTTLPNDDVVRENAPSFASPVAIAPGTIGGDLNSIDDVSDVYILCVLEGQSVDVALDVPDGFDYDMRITHRMGSQSCQSYLAESRMLGGAERIRFSASTYGALEIEVLHHSGAGIGRYALSTAVLSGGTDSGAISPSYPNFCTIGENLQGISLLDGWSSSGHPVSGNTRATMLFNIYDGTYQMNTDYLLTFKYYSSQEVIVQVNNGAGWINIGTLPGRTTVSTASVVVPCEYFHDSQAEVAGMNVELRLTNAMLLYDAGFVAYSYSSDASDIGSVNYPGVSFGTGWTSDQGTIGGDIGAIIVVSVPLTEVAYSLQFKRSSNEEVSVQQYTLSGWIDIGVLRNNGSSMVVMSTDYYDSDADSPGTNVLVRVVGMLRDLSSVTMRPCSSITDVGALGGIDSLWRAFGVCIEDGDCPNSPAAMNGSSVRVTKDLSTTFLLNAPIYGQGYRIDITYTASAAGMVQQYTENGWVDVLTLNAKGRWHTSSFWTKDSIAGQWQNCLASLAFRTTSPDIVVDTLSVSIDSDRDMLVDAEEIALGTNSFSADTDSDGLSDNEELAAGTDPTNPDTDNDGLLDGSERWSQTWSTEVSYVIDDHWQTRYVSVTLQLPALSRVTSATVHWGITHPQSNDVGVFVVRAGDAEWTYIGNGPSSPAFFDSRDLFTLGFTASSFSSARTWTFHALDYDADGNEGRLGYFRIQVDGTTDPLDADTDDDGLLDGEEVSLGVDGWCTNPVLVDTDSDGVSDRNEIIGSTKCGQKLDPTRKDTDGDGFRDNVDKYLGDMMLHFRFSYFNYWQDINYGSTHDIFFTIKIGDKTLSTMRLYSVVKNQPRYFTMDYYIDASDVGTSMSFVMSAVADNAGTLGDDIKLDIEATGADVFDYPFTFYFSNGRTYYVAQGEDESGNWIKDMNTEAEVRWYVETTVRPKANVIVVNSTEEDSGLYKAADNSLRYNEDEQVYLLYITTPSNSANFAGGVNVVIVPRYLALESKLNGTLFAGAGGTELSGAKFYATDDLEDSSSGHIVAVIEKSMTNAQAESLLTRLTHDAGNERIANAVRVAASNVYTLGLPSDVQSRIPYVDMSSSPLGAPPNYLSVGAVFEFVWNCLVTIGTTIVNLVSSLVQAGIDLVCTLTSSAIAAITSVVNEIVDAFNAFVSYAIELITSTVHTILDLVLEPLARMWTGYGIGVCAALLMMVEDHELTGSVSEQSLGRLSQALFGDFFWLCYGVGVAIGVVIVALTGVTSVASFLLGVVISTAVMLIFQSVFSQTVSGTGSSSMNAYTTLLDVEASEALDLAEQMGIAPDTDDDSGQAAKWRTAFAVASFATGIFGSHLGLAALPGGYGYAYKLVIAGMATGLVGAALTLLDPLQMGSDIATFAGFWCGLFSLATGATGTLLARGDPFARNVGTVATGVGVISFGFSIEAVAYHD
jgi:hypothetical protein